MNRIRIAVLTGIGLWLLGSSQSLAMEIYSDASKNQSIAFNGQLRLRGNNFNNFDFTSSIGDRQNFVEQRLRLDLSAHANEHSYGFFQIQDSRIWGQENLNDLDNSTLSSTEGLDLHQAYFHVGNLFSKPGFGITAGRMAKTYGSGRIIGVEDWDNVGRSFNGIEFEVSTNSFYTIDAFYFKVNERDDAGTDNADNDTDLYGAFSSFHPGESLLWQAWFFYNRDVDPALAAATNDARREQLFTAGLRLKGTGGRWFLDAEGSLQWGDVPLFDAADSLYHRADHNAYAIATKVGFQGSGPWSPIFSFGYDRGSGDEDDTDMRSKTWIHLYPTLHESYGYMDLVNWPNVTDLHAHCKLTPIGRASFGADYHRFSLTESSGAKDLGAELDFTLEFVYSESWMILAGYSIFFPGEVVDALAAAANPGVTSADDSQYFYLLTSFGW